MVPSLHKKRNQHEEQEMTSMGSLIKASEPDDSASAEVAQQIDGLATPVHAVRRTLRKERGCVGRARSARSSLKSTNSPNPASDALPRTRTGFRHATDDVHVI